MNIPQPDLIICTPCGERRKKPATKRRHVVDPMTGQEFDLDTCDEHDKKLAAKYLGHALLNGHRRFAKSHSATNGTRIAVATGMAVPKLGAKLGRPRKYSTPEEAQQARNQALREKRAAAKTHVRPESSRLKDAARKRGAYVPLPEGIVKRKDGSFIEAVPPFECGTCGKVLKRWAGLTRHCNGNQHTPKRAAKVVPEKRAKELRALQRSGNKSAPKK